MAVSTEVDGERSRASRLTPSHAFLDPGLTRRLLPFAAVAVIAQISLVLPPGPASWAYAWTSFGLLALVAGLILILKRWRLVSDLGVLVPLTYVASVVVLSLAYGGSSKAGVGIVILIPLIWTALYQRRWESFVVSAAVVTAETVLAFYPVAVTADTLVRRVLFWSALTLLISISTHDLRNRLVRSLGDSEDARRQTESLRSVAEELTTMLDTEQVLATATRAAAVLGSPPGVPGRRAQYARVVGSTVSIVAQYDELGPRTIEPFPLADHPNLSAVVHSGLAVNRPLNPAELGPVLQKVMLELGVTNGVYVPVHSNGVIDGVLTVHIRGRAASRELFECCQAIGHLTELALENARSHELLERLASTDVMTGLMNRRSFDQLLAHRPARLPFSLLMLDLDKMKDVNDSLGHRAGDEFLVYVAHVLSVTLRAGDAVARLGGDEFAVLLLNEEEGAATQTANRILAAFADATFRGQALEVSIGIASGAAGSDGERVFQAADAALYAAKRHGGRRFALAGSVGAEPLGAGPAHLEWGV